MTSPSDTAYTPLEQLLLFQALRAEGNTAGGTVNFSFNRISDQLKSIPAIRNDPAFDGGRLSPDALRELYLWLLKEEVKRDLARENDKEHHTATNGDVSPTSRKRKAASPAAPTVQEAAQHAYLIPQLVSRLYTSYRQKIVKELRDDERKYASLSRDNSEGAAGGLDEQAQRQSTVSATQSPSPSNNAETRPAEQQRDLDNAPPAGSPAPAAASRMGEPTSQPPSRKSTIDAMMNPEPDLQPTHGVHRRTASNTTLPPLSEMAPQSPHFGIPPLPGPVRNAMPPAYAHSPPPAHPSPYAPQHAHPVPNPQIANTVSRQSPSSRVLLPPPPGMNLPPPSPVQHVASPHMRTHPMPPHYQPQLRSSLGPSPTGERPPHAYQPPMQHAPGYYQQQAYPDRRTSYPTQHTQPVPAPQPRYSVSAPQQTGHQFAWQLDPSQHGRHSLGPQPTFNGPRTPRVKQNHGQMQHPSIATQNYHLAQSAPSKWPPAHPSLVNNIIAALATPTRSPRVWKNEDRQPRPEEASLVKEPPSFEPLSPVEQRAPSPPKQDIFVRKRDFLSLQNGSTTPAPKGRPRPRNRSPHSAVSSAADDVARTRTRSQSVSTAGGAPNEQSGRREFVKAEPSTPADTLDIPDHAPEASATPTSSVMTRKRRGTFQSISQPQPPTKRRRPDSPSVALGLSVEQSASTPPPRPTTILATRNFAKMAATIMNDITSHKHASYFAGPVRDKDATGYSEIIKQPQHLKSIRAAITAGTRAIAAATSNLDSPSASIGTPVATSRAADWSTVVELERSEELMPPKAIVNAAQLEKEVYRMLANAVMFNPGEDGLVADTREMFEDVEAKIGEWRGAEREVGATSAAATAAGDIDDDGEASRGQVKRRKA